VALEFMCAWLVRLRDQSAIVPHLVALSMYNWVNGTSVEAWRVLQLMRLLYNRDWTRKWCVKMAAVMPGPRYKRSTVAYCESADNNFVLVSVSIQRVGKTHRNVDMIQRVEYAPPATNASEALPKDMKTPYVRPASWNGLYATFDPANSLLSEQLGRSVAADLLTGARDRVTERPATGVRGQKSWKRYLRPLPDHDPKKPEDMQRYLCKVIRDNGGFLMYLIGADQAFEATVIGCMLARKMFKKVVVVRDLLHIKMWLLCGIWQLCR
jgi:hypothetical protein